MDLLINIMELYFIYRIGKFIFHLRNKKSIPGKLNILVKRRVHHRLDKMIKAQNDEWKLKSDKKVIPFGKRA